MNNSTAGLSEANKETVRLINFLAYFYILPIICVVGIAGNVTNLVVLASRRLRAVSYMYLRALAVADLVCMIATCGFVFTERLKTSNVSIVHTEPYRLYQVHFMLTIINWALGAGVYVVVALSLERYISIVFPLHFRSWNSPQRATKAILTAYIIPFFLYIPYAISRYKMREELDPLTNATIYKMDDHEIYRSTEWQVYKWFRESCLRFLPIIILTALNIQIMLAFRRRQKMFHELTKRKQQGSSAKDDTLMYMLGGTVLMSLICNIPAAVNLIIIDEELKQRIDFIIFRAVANVLEILNHASQFYVFCACSTDYRITFLAKFPCFKKHMSHRERLRSFVRRTQSIVTKDKGSGSNEANNWSPKDSKTAESKLSRLVAEQDTVDVQLMNGEESSGLENENDSDTLFKYGAIAKLITSDSNKSTFL